MERAGGGFPWSLADRSALLAGATRSVDAVAKVGNGGAAVAATRDRLTAWRWGRGTS